jgi:poly-gamma-glutamate synthesis protein (capsule biosynthesis protein)
MPSMILTGDVNLMNVADPAVPFARIGEELRSADVVFANLECCLYQPPGGHAVEHEGFFADPEIAGKALGIAGIAAVGLANNVNYGAAAITASIAQLDRLGIVERVDAAGGMGDGVVVETAQHMDDRIGGADVAQELISQALPV